MLTFINACATRNDVENVSRQNSSDISANSNESENKNLSAQNSTIVQNSESKNTRNANSADVSNENIKNKQSNLIERIEFAKGATSAIVSGNLNDYKDSKSFVIEVRQGQTLRTEQVKQDDSLKYITVEIQDSAGKYVGDSDASCNNRKEINPTTAGDYRINVTECMKADAWRGIFKLKVSVE